MYFVWIFSSPKLKKPDEIAQSDEKKEANKVNPTPVASTNWQFPWWFTFCGKKAPKLKHEELYL